MSDSPGKLAPPAVSCSAALADLYAEDRRDHADVPPVGTAAYRALRERDQRRRWRAAEVLAALEASGGCSAEDQYHAAWLFNHGDQPAEARRAHELAREAAERGHRPARWLAAAAYDRWCMYEGRSQRYGTQFVPDGVGHRLWDVEPATTDDERAAWDVPPLAEQLQRADELTRSEPQPPMEEAPAWLRAAIVRWRSEAALCGEPAPLRRSLPRVSGGVGSAEGMGGAAARRPRPPEGRPTTWEAGSRRR